LRIDWTLLPQGNPVCYWRRRRRRRIIITTVTMNKLFGPFLTEI